MSLVVPNQGEQIMLDAATGKAAATAWTLRLFANNVTPANSDTEAQYTEAAGGGYAAIALTAANWVTTPGSPTSSAYPQQTFTFTGVLTTNPTIYGYYITRADGKLIYAERLAAAFTPANNGDNVQVTPVVTIGSVSGD
jgi:hypothetical protein